MAMLNSSDKREHSYLVLGLGEKFSVVSHWLFSESFCHERMINFAKYLCLYLWNGLVVAVFHSVNMAYHTDVPLLNLTDLLYFPIHKHSPIHKGTILNTRGLVLFFSVCLQQSLESRSLLSGLQYIISILQR